MKARYKVLIALSAFIVGLVLATIGVTATGVAHGWLVRVGGLLMMGSMAWAIYAFRRWMGFP